VKTYTSSTDPVKITEPKLARLHGERYDLIDLVLDGKPLEFPSSAVVGNGLEVAAAINTGSEKKPSYGYGLFKVTNTNTLDPLYREPITGEGLVQVGALHKEAGGWYGMYRTDAGLTVFELNAQGTKEWTTSLPRYKDYWTRVFEWKGDLFLTNCAQESAINGYDKGKDFSSRDNAFQLIPSYLRIHGKDKHSPGQLEALRRSTTLVFLRPSEASQVEAVQAKLNQIWTISKIEVHTSDRRKEAIDAHPGEALSFLELHSNVIGVDHVPYYYYAYIQLQMDGGTDKKGRSIVDTYARVELHPSAHSLNEGIIHYNDGLDLYAQAQLDNFTPGLLVNLDPVRVSGERHTTSQASAGSVRAFGGRPCGLEDHA
jgi:hypothetical protein